LAKGGGKQNPGASEEKAKLGWNGENFSLILGPQKG